MVVHGSNGVVGKSVGGMVRLSLGLGFTIRVRRHLSKATVSGPGLISVESGEGAAANKKVAKGMAAMALLGKMRTRGYIV